MNNKLTKDLISAASVLSKTVNKMNFSRQAAWTYNPLDYAWEGHKAYLEMSGKSKKKVLFLGMNPGPWGMAQCGVPFGEIPAVRDWLKLSFEVRKPEKEHPSRPVEGLDCKRKEVSGQRFWGLMADKFIDPDAFFKDHFVENYCPLSFMEEGGKNITPDKMPAAAVKKLYAACDVHLVKIIELLEPEWLIGIGKYAEKRLLLLAKQKAWGDKYQINNILHPSPASPHANRGWAPQTEKKMTELKIW